jgi:hypothetical protein
VHGRGETVLGEGVFWIGGLLEDEGERNGAGLGTRLGQESKEGPCLPGEMNFVDLPANLQPGLGKDSGRIRCASFGFFGAG